jgi:hypothetical protein
VGFAAAGRQKIKGAVGSSDKTIEAGANKDGRFYLWHLLSFHTPGFYRQAIRNRSV